jgi:arylsulfatase A-like enzyme
MSHRIATAAALTLWAVAGGCFGEAPKLRSPLGFRHVLLISVDTLRADFLASYGLPFVESPHVDRLAREGLLFEQHIAVASTTLASHTSLMTGSYPRTHGTPRNSFVVNDDNAMLAEELGRGGFGTAAFIGGLPLLERFNFDQGFDHFDEPGPDVGSRSAAEVTSAALDWLKGTSADRLFVFVHFFDVHYPYVQGEPWDSMYRDDALDVTGSIPDGFRVIHALREGIPAAQAMSDARKRAYAGGVTYVDTQIGRLVDGLEALDLLDETLVIVTSDHGESMDLHPAEYWDHGRTVFEEVAHIPLIMRFPSAWRRGERIPQLIANIDVAPTLLDLLDLPVPEAVEGRSFAPLLRGEDAPVRGAVFIEATKPHGKRYEADTVWRNERKMQGVRTERWKLIHEPLTQRIRFYDLRADRSEQDDLSAATVAAAPMADLRDHLRRREGGAAAQDAPADLDEQTRARLRALGYGS